MTEHEVGKVSSYFSHAGVAAIKLSKPLKVGDKIRIKGSTTNFEQTVESMQVEKDQIDLAKPGDHVGIRVEEKVRQNDTVFLIE
jgi:putative protease